MTEPTEHQLLNAVGKFYSAGLGECSWEVALEGHVGLFGGAGGNIFKLEPDVGEVTVWHDHGLEAGADPYTRYIHSICPRIAESFNQPAGHVDVDYDFIRDDEMDRHEFYAWLQKVAGMRYFMGMRLYDGESQSLFTSVEYTSDHGHVDDRTIATFARIAPHIANAWRISDTLAAAQNDRQLSQLLRSNVAWGLIGLDASGEVLFTNDKALELLRLQDGIEICHRQLSIWQSAANRTLQAILHNALQTARGEGFSPGGSVSVSRPSRLPDFALRIVPVAGGEAAADMKLAALVYVLDPVNGAMIDTPQLASIYGLTPTEAALAVELYRTCSLHQAADAIGAAYNTGRAHLRSIFIKTGTSSQLELIKLLGSLGTLWVDR